MAGAVSAKTILSVGFFNSGGAPVESHAVQNYGDDPRGTGSELQADQADLLKVFHFSRGKGKGREVR